MRPLFARLAVTAVLAVVFVGGWASDHYLTPPHPVFGDKANAITKWCTPVGTGSIPPPWNSWIPAQYRNGTYQLYSCKVN